MSPHVPRLRMAVLGVVVVSLFSVLSVRLYDLQIVGTDDYQVQAEANRVRTVNVSAPRGRILDRDGKVIVDNRVASVVGVNRNEFLALPEDERNAMLLRLQDELARDGHRMSAERIRNRIQDQRFNQYAPVPIVRDVSEELRIYLAEHADEFPAVVAERTAVREYPYGRAAANLLGYVGAINEDELADREDQTAKPYDLNDQIGKAGVELGYEPHLRGTPGTREIEVDAEGNAVRVIEETLPAAGSDIYLSIDVDLQVLAQQRLEQGLEEARQRPPRAGRPQNQGTRGAVVVEDPRNGQVLAMASYPTYDPREFIDGISNEQWEYLNDPANQYPLNNWAIQGQWAPGSSFKLFTAYAALASGVWPADRVYYDGGGYSIPGCTGSQGCFISNAGGANGALTLPSAITVSSNAFFANVGGQFWLQRESLPGGEEAMQQYMAAMGVGEQTGIPLAYEEAGRLPSAVWAREYCAEVGGDCDPYWATAHNAQMAIGQGSVQITPLQLANGYATMANGGNRYVPQIVDRIVPPNGEPRPVRSEVAQDVNIPPQVRQPIVDGMVGVTQSGTAASAFGGFPHESFPIAGKTGTGEFEEKAHTATFSSFGPVNDPRYAISVVMEESDFGGTAAAPVARSLYDVLSGTEPMPSAQRVGGGN